MSKYLQLVVGLFICFMSQAQLKVVIEDFEGYADGQTDLSEDGVFSFGSVNLMTLQHITLGYGYSGERALKVQWNSKEGHGGWGIGIGTFKELDVVNDYLNFYLYCPKVDTSNYDRIKISLEDDDNLDGSNNKSNIDIWYFDLKVKSQNDWQLISIPLSQLRDGNSEGDGKFNLSFRTGKLLSLNFSFENVKNYTPQNYWYFDFISFSKSKLNSQNDIFSLPLKDENDFCSLGAWSKSEHELNYLLIAKDFENNFKCNSPGNKQLSLVSFYKPFSADSKTVPNIYPSLENLDDLIKSGYLPMITLEAQFAKTVDSVQQPNLYAIIEGHFDYYFADWARRLKKVKSPVLLRILHEFNGDWYPWCIANNDNDPKLFVKAYQHIRQIFWDEKAINVNFVWCPNSMSLPQQPWNFIMDAYPGNDYVDVVGLDIFNGAGEQKENVWHSFRKLTTDNYFIIKQNIPDKPFIICETSCRERTIDEKGYYQSKAKWIEQQAEALQSDFSKVNLLIWFNQYDKFIVNSSAESTAAYQKHLWSSEYFNSKNNQ